MMNYGLESSTIMQKYQKAILHFESFFAQHNAVSSEWNCLSADWNQGKSSKLFKCISNCCKQVYSITLDKNDVYDKGRSEYKISGSLSFYSIGLKKAIFSHSGNVPDLKVRMTRSHSYSASFFNFVESKVFISNVSFRQNVSLNF